MGPPVSTSSAARAGSAWRTGPDANSLKNSALFGLRFGVYFGNAIGVEAEAGIIPTEPRQLVFDVYSLAYRASLVYQFRAANADNRIVPFVLAGGGALQIFDSANETQIMKETNVAFHLGVGAKYRTQNDWGVRLDARALLVPSSEGGQTQDFELLLSALQGVRPAEEGGREGPAPAHRRGSGQGRHHRRGGSSARPSPRTSMASRTSDGCPDPDNDGDGIPDATDKCPLEAEDKDNFQDDDGCPDPDNDGDGVPDAADKCPDQPETKNGFEDDDGCPDEIPEKLKQFTGVIQGITFKVSSADLQPASNRLLDKAVAVLAEFGDIRLEIQGHTDDQPLTKSKTFADNKALSQARAESVKAYFVKKGIDEGRLTANGYGDEQPVEDPTGLTGGKLNAARAKNRRVEFKLISTLGEAGAAPAPAPTE